MDRCVDASHKVTHPPQQPKGENVDSAGQHEEEQRREDATLNQLT